jgi:DNA-binding NarL/FixJ family response regulator
MEPVRTRIVIADDQSAIRKGFRYILESEPDMEVVAEAADGVEALAAVTALVPDVVLADIRMPRLDGLELTRRVVAEVPSARVVIVTTFDVDEYVRTALQGGACGFVLKGTDPALLVAAVRAAVAGDALLSPQITTRLLSRLEPRVVQRSVHPADSPLTQREEEIAALVAHGMTNADIAEELFISLGTVKTHLTHLQKKLEARNRVGIAAWVWESGLIRRGGTSARRQGRQVPAQE